MSEQSHAPKQSGFFRSFIEHPASVDETYFQHLAFAFRFSVQLFLAALAALVHALIPPLFETTAGDTIKKLHADISARHSKQDS